ncbi:MAG: N(2)-acetyl-L-2,4-diaminobutanoate deacetylase DoeB2 [Geobacteraceae bacterium]|nr:N(2)-acetyl-L-2,4-diaminobutanoate deacetylase DoeB2 [Geobacteraceae bacterium]
MTRNWQQVIDSAIRLRHQLHQKPELTWQEFGTAEAIREQLEGLQIPWRSCADTGTLAWLNPESSGRHIGLRADMDALPINEETDCDYVSQYAGRMHACGHDGHTAALIATADWLKQHEHALKGPVTLIFQPAEEGGHGAKKMIEDGALEGVDEIYAWHNWPAIKFGKIACPDDVVMSGNGSFEIEVNGRGGHASQPELCADPVLAASAINISLQQIVSRRMSPQKPVVLSVTSIEAPSGVTVIPATALMSGSIRVPDSSSREQLNQLITSVSQNIAQAYGVTCEVRIFPRYEATRNHPGCASRLRTAWQQDQGEHSLDKQFMLPAMASEDFSYYLQQIPGAFALIGSDDGIERHQYPCHSAYYDFNDGLIEKVVKLYSRLVGVDIS